MNEWLQENCSMMPKKKNLLQPKIYNYISVYLKCHKEYTFIVFNSFAYTKVLALAPIYSMSAILYATFLLL